MSDAFERLLDRMVPGSGKHSVDAPHLPPTLGLEPGPIIARGSVGWLMRARDPMLQREVAVKLSAPERGREGAESVLQEARTTARIAHRAVLPVHRAVDLGDTAAIVFRLAPRLTLGTMLFGDMRHLIDNFPIWDRLRMALEGASAVAHAHSQDVVHGDLHPGNVAIGNIGELFVLDWGGVAAEQDTFSGHPAYAAPETLVGGLPSAQADVYALACLIWEVMTLRSLRPRRQDEEVGAWILRLQGEPLVAPDAPATMDPALARLLVAGMAPSPEDRPTARDIVGGARAVMTGQEDLRRRRDEATALLSRSREALERYADLGEQVAAEQKVAAVQRAVLPHHAPVEQKLPLWKTESRMRTFMVEQELTWLTAAEQGVRALALAPDEKEARRALAELWWARLRQAESGGSPAEIAMSLSRLEQYDDGVHSAALSAPAHLSLVCAMPDAEARIERFVMRDRQLVPEHLATHPLPLERLELDPGSWRVVVSAPGHVSASYPVALRRGHHHRGGVTLVRTDQLDDDWVQVPGGAFHMGGDPIARLMSSRVGGRGPLRGFNASGDPLARQALDSCSPTVEDLFVMRTPVTVAQYAAFLAELDPAEAHAHAPGSSSAFGASRGYWPDRGGRPTLPADWDPLWPVFGVNLDDVRRYAAWASARAGVTLRLPTEIEWEKAARGVDGRPFPWGAEFDPTFAHMRRSRPGPARPAKVGSYPADVSVYGCTDMAGCVREWTASAFDADLLVVRGGSWQDDEDDLRLASRAGFEPGLRHENVGFRLVSSAPVP